MSEDKRALRKIELWLSKNRQAEAECNRAEANVRKAEAALRKFRAKQPHKKQKPGRPGFWKSPRGPFLRARSRSGSRRTKLQHRERNRNSQEKSHPKEQMVPSACTAKSHY
jgi:hypothetical protein